ncbi:multidrug effflux MFS transporter [Chitinophaga oryziterrae]|nr:multidrug effflux MFS transporter [Chitinophaga oryziterrae]
MQEEMPTKKYFFLILILGTLTALGPFSIDMYLPGFEAIALDLHTTSIKIGFSLSSYFIGISAGQLLYGPLLDRFGRKKPLYIGLTLYILASIGCITARTLDALVILRFFQAIGSCAAAVASVAMVRDLFPVKDSAKVFSLLMLVVGASPMIAPTVGGYVTTAFGWQTVFVILAVMGILILLASIFFLPESYQPDVHMSLKPGPIIMNFLAVIREPQFYTYALTGALAFSGLFAYVSGSPVMFMDIFHLSKNAYGWIFAGLSVGFIGSSQLNSLVLRRYSSDQIIIVGLICQAITGIIFLIGTYLNWYGLPATIVMLFIFLCCLGFVNPNASALSIAPFKKNAGSAAALMGALQMSIGALASVGVSLFNTNSALPMVSIMAGSAILGVLTLVAGRKQTGHPVLMQEKGDNVVMH